MEYEKLLDNAYEKVEKTDEGGKGRFEIPKIEGHFQGKKTVLTNFFQISSFLGRSGEHFQKFISKELATSGYKSGERLILNNKIPRDKINKKIDEYVKEFVICRECGKPDTEIIKKGKISYVHCLACGASHPIRSKI
ncbi:MAG TPA: translation initiation factor IF-2 subunit beta [Candidatus Nanoarchaeia archaeon]|nr:translation initiation factor IF-2 subunit beta [Candidatus Nanoarchaeia archaeon]